MKKDVYLGNHYWASGPKPIAPRRETFWACPDCGSRRVHIMSTGDGIICCGFHPFKSEKYPSLEAIRVIPPQSKSPKLTGPI